MSENRIDERHNAYILLNHFYISMYVRMYEHSDK